MSDDDLSMAAVARLAQGLDDLSSARGRLRQDICDCGQEVQSGEDHSMCFPGMD